MNPRKAHQLASLLPEIESAKIVFSNDGKKGDVSADFHYACDSLSGLLVVAKRKNYIAGGYNSENWKGNKFKSSAKNFMFSLNRNSVYPIAKPSEAVCANPTWVANFGRGFIRKRWTYQKVTLPAGQLKRV